ncbi:DUF563 domain-containing protein [bacterium]|nr:DUF563 domain-containing protein [bacterium]
MNGIRVPSQAISAEEMSAGVDGISLRSTEDPLVARYPCWNMLGAVDDVPRQIDQLSKQPDYDPAGEAWRGNLQIGYPPGQFIEVPQGSVLSRGALIFSQSHRIVTDLCGVPVEEFYMGSESDRFIPGCRQVSGRLLVFASGVAQRNYYHWVVEMLPQMRLFDQPDTAFDYLAVPQRKSFVRESLELMGVDPAKIIPLQRLTHLRADQLLVPSPASPYSHPSGVKFLREKMRSAPWSHFDREDRERIYISRKRRGSRRLIEENQLLELLQPLGFRPVLLEEMSVQEQIQLFQRAEAVVGPHGAGFTNTIFCRPGTVVMEISPSCRPRTFFHCIADINKLNFAIYFGRSVNQQGVDADISIDPQDFCQHLAEILYRQVHASELVA